MWMDYPDSRGHGTGYDSTPASHIGKDQDLRSGGIDSLVPPYSSSREELDADLNLTLRPRISIFGRPKGGYSTEGSMRLIGNGGARSASWGGPS